MADSEKKSKVKVHLRPVVWGLIFSLNLSLITLIFYAIDPDFPEKVLFFLLGILRYSSFCVCIISVYLFIANIRRMIHHPGVITALKIVLFFLSLVYGAGIIVFYAFITALAGGNG